MGCIIVDTMSPPCSSKVGASLRPRPIDLSAHAYGHVTPTSPGRPLALAARTSITMSSLQQAGGRSLIALIADEVGALQ